MTFEELQAIMTEIAVAQREFRSDLAETRSIAESAARAADSAARVAESAARVAESAARVAESNGRAIQAMLDQAAEDRLKREEEKAEHERRMARLEDISAGLVNLLSSIDEDRPTILRKLNTIDGKVDTIIERLPPS